MTRKEFIQKFMISAAGYLVENYNVNDPDPNSTVFYAANEAWNEIEEEIGHGLG